MTGLADGFATGWGLVDKTYNESADRELKNKQLNQQADYQAGHLSLMAAQDKVQNEQFGKTLANNQLVHQDEVKYKNAGLKNDGTRLDQQGKVVDAQVSKMQADSNNDQQKIENDTKTTNATVDKYKADTENAANRTKIDQQQANASGGLAQAHTAQVEAETNAKKRKETYESAMNVLAYHFNQKTGDIDIPDDVDQQHRLKLAMHTIGGIDSKDIHNAPEEYHRDIGMLQDAFDNHQGGNLDDPIVMGAFNRIMPQEVKAGVGEEVPGKGKVIDKNAAGIKEVKVPPTAENPSGIGFMIMVQSTYEKDGKKFNDAPGPMTELRSSNPNIIGAPKIFTPAQLHSALNLKAMYIDEVTAGKAADYYKRLHPKEQASYKNEKLTDANGNEQLIAVDPTNPGNPVDVSRALIDNGNMQQATSISQQLEPAAQQGQPANLDEARQNVLGGGNPQPASSPSLGWEAQKKAKEEEFYARQRENQDNAKYPGYSRLGLAAGVLSKEDADNQLKARSR